MLIVISPAKTLDFTTKIPSQLKSEPEFKKEANQLASLLKKFDQAQLSKLMSISPKLAELNYNRYQVWQSDPDESITRQAIFAFKGNVYNGLQAYNFSDIDLDFAKNHLIILSGLYGILSPLDLIQEYRLEMGIKLENNKGNNLYTFWKAIVTKNIEKLIKSDDNIIINLASDEYFNSIQHKTINARIIKPVFKDYKNGSYKFLSVYGKKARGLMTRFIIKNQITNPEQLKLFDLGGYYYNHNLTKGDTWVFTRDNPKK